MKALSPSSPSSTWVSPENVLLAEDRTVHDWYRFVLSFPAHLVRSYLDDFGLGADSTVLDPFCGTGTTLVEAKFAGVVSVGIEAAPMAYLASSVKTDWSPDPAVLVANAEAVACEARRRTATIRKMRQLPHPVAKLLLTDSISPKPLHRVLVLLEAMATTGMPAVSDFHRLALAKILPTEVGNLRFGPEVGVGKIKQDAPVIDLWLDRVKTIAADLEIVQQLSPAAARVIHADSRDIASLLAPGSIDAVFTSPPYPNEKDYTRTTRLESVILGMVTSLADLRLSKKGLIRSNTRGIYKEDTDDRWVSEHPEVQRIAAAIEERRVKLGKTSGFERQYARVTKLYFGGMARHLADLQTVLRPGARLGYVVGDQASYLRVLIRTGEILGDIAEHLGYRVDRIDLFRSRPATATRQLLREEVLILTWPGR